MALDTYAAGIVITKVLLASRRGCRRLRTVMLTGFTPVNFHSITSKACVMVLHTQRTAVHHEKQKVLTVKLILYLFLQGFQ